MDYLSFQDLADAVALGRATLPSDIDGVIAASPGGLLAAALLGPALAVTVQTVDDLLGPGREAARVYRRERYAEALLVTDCGDTEEALAVLRGRLERAYPGVRLTTVAVFAGPDGGREVDLVLRRCAGRPVAAWRLMEDALLEQACVDIDGVLCRDPETWENDDGPAYQAFLERAKPLHRPRRRIRHLVTSRLERDRDKTEDWLRRHEVAYDRLSMLDLPDAATRRRLRAHAPFKARVYRDDAGAGVFIESEPAQARVIAESTGRPVICVGDQRLHRPAASAPASARVLRSPGWARWWTAAVGGAMLRRGVRGVAGP